MEKAIKINGKQWPQHVQLQTINDALVTQHTNENTENDLSTPKVVEKQANFLDLFKTPNLRKNTLIQYFNWFTVVLVYYGITLNADTLIPGKFLKY